MTPELLTTIALVLLAVIGFKMQKSTLGKIKHRNLDRYLGQDYKTRLENKQILHPSRNQK